METEHDDGPKAVNQKSGNHFPSVEKRQGIDRILTRYIGDHPAVCLTAALALGFLVARLTRGRR
jgi:hypothetical protein